MLLDQLSESIGKNNNRGQQFGMNYNYPSPMMGLQNSMHGNSMMGSMNNSMIGSMSSSRSNYSNLSDNMSLT